MSLWSRLGNVFRGGRVNRDLDEEFEFHIAEAVAQGRDPEEARRAFGGTWQQREASRDVKIAVRLDSLRADVVFGWRQLKKRKTTSLAAILSLGLAIGACTSAFRLVDALLLRPLPVSHPERLYIVGVEGIDAEGRFRFNDGCSYPLFRRMRPAAKAQAELIAISFTDRLDVTYGGDAEMEKANRQYVSGWMFDAFGIRPALGRLLQETDDVKPGAHPVAVLSYDYWESRFGRDPRVLGRKFKMGGFLYEMVGVAEAGFTGTETGAVTGIFVPTAMNTFSINRSDLSWFRTFVRLNPGVTASAALESLRPTVQAFREEQAKGQVDVPKEAIENYLRHRTVLEPAAAGVSGMQRDYREALTALAVLVGMVLLIACANVANLMTAQAAGRVREMALRVSIGAGRARLLQLVLIEAALMGICAAAVGGCFAWWSAPLVVTMANPQARLILPADWRVFGFGILLTLLVMGLFGLAPALRASAARPAAALKGGEEPRSRNRLMLALVALQVSFCFLVHFAAGLFVATFEKLANRPTGFSTERILVLDTMTAVAQSPAAWNQAAEHLRRLPGVETVAFSGWPLLGPNSWSASIAIGGGPIQDPAYLLNISPGWIAAMKIPLRDGRDFRADEVYPSTAIVNEVFATRYFGNGSPVGKWFERVEGDGRRSRIQVVGSTGNALYHDAREPFLATAYMPFSSLDAKGVLQNRSRGSFIVRTTSRDPLLMAPVLRREMTNAGPGFRVTNVFTQQELVRARTIRERLLATLALFFAGIALLLAGVGLYGVLHYSVLQRRREIGIRMALGARKVHIARQVTAGVFLMTLAGAAAGLTLGLASVRYIATLLYGVRPGDIIAWAAPSATILAAVLLAALPAVLNALRTDPAQTLRSE